MTLTVFDKNKEFFNERSKHIDYILENDNNLRKQITKQVCVGERIEDSKLGEYLDNIANYLLESKDVESGRKIKNDYYRSEKDYHSNFAIGKHTVPVDSQTISSFSDSSEHIDYSINGDYLRKLFSPEKLSEDDIRRFIVAGYNYTKVKNKELGGAVKWLNDEIWLVASKGEKEIIKLFDGNRKIKEVAEIKGITSQAISYYLKNISQKVINSLTFS